MFLLLKKMEDVWAEFKGILKEYPDFFPKGSFDRDLFNECYGIVMTRSYGKNIFYSNNK